MSMEDYEQKLANIIANRGWVVSERYSQFHGIDTNWWDHRKNAGCRVAKISDVKEDEWDEFDGTDMPFKVIHGVQATFSCECGRFTDRKLRYEATVAELLAELLDFSMEGKEFEVQACPYTHAHTRHWCGYDGCRES